MTLGEQIIEIRKTNPNNIMAETFDLERFEGLSAEDKVHVLRVIKSGLDNPDSSVGAYAMSPDDYEKYPWLLDPIVQKYHRIDKNFRQKSNWNLEGDFGLDQIDPNLKDASMRVRVARNTTEFPLPGAMSKADRIAFETRMIQIFEKLIQKPEFGGSYVSLSPGSKYEISKQKYQDLVNAHKMFKDMSADPYLNSAGISADWPFGRGLYESANGQMIVWVNEEDQLRIISMAIGSDLSVVFKNLKRLLEEVESSGLTFATSKKFGNVTSCPSNIGTGMRASVLVKLPNLTKNEPTLKGIAKNYGLSVRGMAGEHTSYGSDGLTDVSPSARMGVTEAEILRYLYQGIVKMLEAEAAA